MFHGVSVLSHEAATANIVLTREESRHEMYIRLVKYRRDKPV